jgi:hypothetical protein
MGTPHEEMAQLIFDVLSGKGHEIYMYDERGTQVFDATQANRLWSADEKLMVILGSTKGKPPKPLVTFYTSDVTNLDRFNDIKFALKKHNPWDFSFDTDHFGRTLEPKHFQHMNVTEAQDWSGSTRTSRLPVDGCLVVVRHTRPWNKDTLDQAQRWRRIKSIMLHTPRGERFQFPYKHLLGARAMAQHLTRDTHMHDTCGCLIQNLVKTLGNMRRFQVRAGKLGADELRYQIHSTRAQIKKLLTMISDASTYDTGIQEAQSMINSWKKPKPLAFREARELDSWFNSFDVRPVVESSDPRSEVYAAWQAADRNKYRTLDYLKRNQPGWLSRFEEDPESVTDEISSYIEEFENEEY